MTDVLTPGPKAKYVESVLSKVFEGNGFREYMNDAPYQQACKILQAADHFELIDLLDSVERWHMCVGVYQCEDAWEDVLSALKAALKGGEGD